MTGPTYRETSKVEPAKELVQKRALVAEAELRAAGSQYATDLKELFHPQLPMKATARNLYCLVENGPQAFMDGLGDHAAFFLPANRTTCRATLL